MFNKKQVLRACLSAFMPLIGSEARPQGYFGTSAGCHDNVNWGGVSVMGRQDVISSSFKILFSNGGPCTATLVNRAVDQDDLGYYFIMARHCLYLGPDVPLSTPQTLVFNYQSSGVPNSSTPYSNRGFTNNQSTSLNPSGFPDNPYGYEYRQQILLTKVADVPWGDFVLMRIETPLPPHFNVYYSGWNPSELVADGISFGNSVPCNLANRFGIFHHPKGDIKKAAGANQLLNPTAPTYAICDVVTTVIDVLFGWIWGNSSSTQVICNYVDIPWYTVPYWCSGGTEEGSSGSGLFNPANRFIGPLSGDLFVCSGVATTTFGKFKNVYPQAAIKNTLNPSNNLGIDLWGINGRRISCYTNLVLPGGHQQAAYYFPANHYQSENRIQLRAQGSITVAAPITILSGAHYEFLAGNFIDINALNALNAMVDVHAGATLDIRPEGCTKSAPTAQNEAPAFEFQRLPERLVWQPEETKADAPFTGYLLLQPNPTNGSTLLVTDLAGPLQVSLMSATGQLVQDASIRDAQMDVSSLPAGMYLMRAVSERGELRTARLVRE
jgi:hypothetical protein